MPAPHAPFYPSRGSAPQQVERVDHDQRDQHRNRHVAQDRDGRRHQAQDGQVGAHPAHVNRKERRDEGQRPPAVNRPAHALGRLDVGGDGDGLGLIGQPELVDDALVGLGRGVDRRRHDVPGDAGDPERAGNRDYPRRCRAAQQQEQYDDGRVAKGRQPRAGSRLAVGGADGADRITDGIDREPAGHDDPQRLGRDKRRVDQENGDRHADDGADGGRATRRGRRSPQRVQPLDERGERQQCSDAGCRKLRAAQGRSHCEQRERERHDCQARDGGATSSGSLAWDARHGAATSRCQVTVKNG